MIGPRALWYLLWLEWKAAPWRYVLLTLCATLAGTICTLSLHALYYARAELRPHLDTLFPENRVIVRPLQLDVSILRFEGLPLDDQLVEEIAAREDVARVYPQLPPTMPISAEVFIGRRDLGFQSEVVLHGVSPELLSDELKRPEEFVWKPGTGDPVPVVASAYFLDLYNMGLAESSNLPKLSPKAAIGRKFTLLIGESTVLSFAKETVQLEAELVALTNNTSLVGLSAPIEAVAHWNADLSGETERKYSALHVDLVADATVDALEAWINEKGFRVVSLSESLDIGRRITTYAEIGLMVFTLSILFLAFMGISSTTSFICNASRPSVGLLKAEGMSVPSLLYLQSKVFGVPAFLSGVACSLSIYGISLALERLVGPALDQSAILPSNPLELGIPTLVTALVVPVTMILLGGLSSVFGLVRTKPLDLINERSL